MSLSIRILLGTILSLFVLVACSKEEHAEQLQIPSGRWLEEDKIYPSFLIYEWSTYDIQFAGNKFKAVIILRSDIGTNDCNWEREFFIDGTYTMDKDTIHMVGFYYESDFQTKDKRDCIESNIFSLKKHYKLEDKLLIFNPNHYFPYFVDSLYLQ